MKKSGVSQNSGKKLVQARLSFKSVAPITAPPTPASPTSSGNGRTMIKTPAEPPRKRILSTTGDVNGRQAISNRISKTNENVLFQPMEVMVLTSNDECENSGVSDATPTNKIKVPQLQVSTDENAVSALTGYRTLAQSSRSKTSLIETIELQSTDDENDSLPLESAKQTTIPVKGSNTTIYINVNSENAGNKTSLKSNEGRSLTLRATKRRSLDYDASDIASPSSASRNQQFRKFKEEKLHQKKESDRKAEEVRDKKDKLGKRERENNVKQRRREIELKRNIIHLLSLYNQLFKK